MVFKKRYTPYKRRFKGKHKSFRRFKKRYSRRKTSTATMTKVSGYPIGRSLTVKLKYYAQPFSLTALAGSQAQYIFRANSIFDCDLTGAGQQPFGYDQYSNFYARWTVTGCKATFRFTPTTSGASSYTRIGLQFGPNAAWLATQWPILPLARTKILAGTNAADGSKSVKMYCSTAKAAGVSKKKINTEDNWSGATGANPVNVTYLYVNAQQMSAADATALAVDGFLTYYVKFWSMINITES